ncbi:hypothetical protein BDA99DRAFT_521746 [Phascolomyces articulosus]|uniref:Uncharacterized protein n=1 Tax=Phascolomyces articulosus TaxID=60185 RepID=A0AAD5JSA1_9FUNG|nr:hypothetical protein BDA99DRAFT_521746 [Phascolomyces articulosus]
MIDAIVHLKCLKALAIISPRVGFVRGLSRLIQGLATSKTTKHDLPSLERLVISRQASHHPKKFRLYNSLIVTTAGDQEEESDPNSTQHYFDMLQHIPSIASLKTIEFHGVNVEEYNNNSFEKQYQAKEFTLFCRKLQMHPSIEVLECIKMNCISSESLHHLSKSMTLRQLILDSHGLNNVQERDLCVFNDHPSIKMIRTFM